MDIAVGQETPHGQEEQRGHEPSSQAAPADLVQPAPGSISRFFGNTWAITKKELMLYFSTPLAYVLLSVFMFIMGYFFFALTTLYQSAMLRAQQMEQFQPGLADRLNFTDVIFVGVFRNAGIIYLIIIPFLTMRLLADEKRQNTFQLLMTTPLRPWEIVLGKFFSSQLVLTLSLVLTLAYPLLLNSVAVSGGVEWETAGAVYLGYFLFTMTYVAIGLFISSLTENPVVAALVTALVLLVLFILSFASSAVESGTAKDVLDFLCVTTHLQAFGEGIIKLADVTYFVSVTLLALVLTRTSVERTRW